VVVHCGDIYSKVDKSFYRERYIVDESSNYEEQRRLLYILPTDDGSKTMTKLSSESLLFVEPKHETALEPVLNRLRCKLSWRLGRISGAHAASSLVRDV
jgi:hypothetical protein